MAKKSDDTKDTKKSPAKAKAAEAAKAPKVIRPKVGGAAGNAEGVMFDDSALDGAQKLPMMIHAQYVKDISFENPNAPFTLMLSSGRPEIEVNFGMDARKMDLSKMSAESHNIDNLYEVILSTTIQATKQGKPAYIIEIEYGMSVSLNDIPEERHHSLLLIEMPKYMFPYVRQLVADLSGHGGYSPLMLTPVNFSKFYMDRFGKKSVSEGERANA